MNTSTTTNTTAIQNPQIIRVNYNGQINYRRIKPTESPQLQLPRVLISGPASTSATATVPQIVSVLSPTALTNNVISVGPPSDNSNVNGETGPNAKKCTFHRQCFHVQQQHQQQQQQQQPASQQVGVQSQQVQTIQLPSQLQHITPQQQQHQQQLQLHHQALQQQIRLTSASNPTINRVSTQANRDAISTNVAPQLNAALLQDRYLLLDLVDGSSFYRSIDIQTQKPLVCKVSSLSIHPFVRSFVRSFDPLFHFK